VAARERARQGNWAEQQPQRCEREWKVARMEGGVSTVV